EPGGERSADETEQRDRVGPAPRRPLDDPEYETADRDDRQQRTERVDAGGARFTGLGDHEQGRDQRDDREPRRDDEDGTPPPLLEHRSRAQETDHPARTRDTRPDANGFGSLARWEHARDGRHGRRHDDGGTDTGADPHA